MQSATYGATGNGTTDDTVAINAAITAALAATNGGIVYLPPGVYKTSAVLGPITSPKVSVLGAGSGATWLQPTSAVTADVLRVQVSGVGSGGVDIEAGRFGWMTIDGTNAGAGAVGLHYGDTLAGYLDDLQVQNFTGAGSIGIYMDNNRYWTERTTFVKVALRNNTTGILWGVTGTGTASFEHTMMLDLKLEVSANQTGFLMTGGQITGGVVNITGNFSNTAAVFVKLNTGVGGALGSNSIHIHGDSQNAGSKGIYLAAGDSIYSCIGYVDVGSTATNTDLNFGSSFTGHWNVPGINVKYAGPLLRQWPHRPNW